MASTEIYALLRLISNAMLSHISCLYNPVSSKFFPRASYNHQSQQPKTKDPENTPARQACPESESVSRPFKGDIFSQVRGGLGMFRKLSEQSPRPLHLLQEPHAVLKDSRELNPACLSCVPGATPGVGSSNTASPRT